MDGLEKVTLLSYLYIHVWHIKNVGVYMFHDLIGIYIGNIVKIHILKILKCYSYVY